MSLTSAWESRGAPMATFGKNLTDLTFQDSSLIFFRNLTTGRDKGQIPGGVRMFRNLMPNEVQAVAVWCCSDTHTCSKEYQPTAM